MHFHTYNINTCNTIFQLNIQINVLTPTSSIASLTAKPSQLPASTVGTDTIVASLKALTDQIASMQASAPSYTRSRNLQRRSRSRHSSGNSTSPHTARRSSGHCWYHFKFGNEARHCVQPCTFNYIHASSNHPKNIINQL